MAGNQLHDLPISRPAAPASVAIDSNDNKYVLDLSTPSIHVLNSADKETGVLSINLPANFGTIGMGTIHVGADQTLTLYLEDWATLTYLVEKLKLDGTQIFSRSWRQSDFAVDGVTADSNGNTFVAGYDHVKVLDPTGNDLGQFDIGIYAGTACGITQQGNTAFVCYYNQIYGFTAQ